MEEIGEGLGQGGLESAILSSNSIANGLETFFKDSTNEINYRNVRLQPQGYQDDIARGSTSVDDARAGIAKLEAMADSKILTFNHSKSSLVIIGSNKKRKEI